jgi:hypothetical protein
MVARTDPVQAPPEHVPVRLGDAPLLPAMPVFAAVQPVPDETCSAQTPAMQLSPKLVLCPPLSFATADHDVRLNVIVTLRPDKLLAHVPDPPLKRTVRDAGKLPQPPAGVTTWNAAVAPDADHDPFPFTAATPFPRATAAADQAEADVLAWIAGADARPAADQCPAAVPD